MFNAESFKFMENDTVNISQKEDYINNSYYYKNNELLRDSSYFFLSSWNGRCYL